MKIIIGGKLISLIPRDVKIARELVNDFLKSVEKNAFEKNAPALFFTTLIMMHIKSQDEIKAITPETMQIILQAAETGYNKLNGEKKSENK